MDISPLIVDMQSMLRESGEKQKELLRQEILQMSGYALSGEIVERQFYISIWEKQEDGAEKDLFSVRLCWQEKFTGNGIGCDVLTEKEIVRLLNLINQSVLYPFGGHRVQRQRTDTQGGYLCVNNRQCRSRTYRIAPC